MDDAEVPREAATKGRALLRDDRTLVDGVALLLRARASEEAPKVRVDPKSRIYNRMRVHTGQPDLVPDGGGQGEHGIKEEGSVLAALDLPAANVMCEWPA